MKTGPCLAALVAVVVSGCVAPAKQISVATTFDPKTAAYAKSPGTGKIDGQAFMKQVGGNVVTAAGEPVFLLPAVAYTDEIIAATSSERGAYARELDLNINPALERNPLTLRRTLLRRGSCGTRLA